MARIKKGILGPFSGKIGTVVGASWYGIDYMRSLPRKSNKPASEAQLAQQNKMALLRGFLLGVDDIIAKCFQNIKKYTPMNDALSYNLLSTIEGTYPDQRINFTQLLFSKGELRGAWSPEVHSTEHKTVDFSWENGNLMSFCAADDQAILVIYDPEEKQFCLLDNAALRSEKAARIIVPQSFTGHAIHCYISFYSVHRKLASTNEYLGMVTVL